MKISQTILLSVLAILAGAAIPFQSAMNSALGKSLQSPYYSALTVFLVAFIAMGSYMLLSKQGFPTATQFLSAPKWSFFGGILGAIYILLIIILAPKLGIGNVTVMVLTGQVLAAVIIDQFGILGAQVHPISWPRLTGIILLCAGVFLIKKH